jgi:hypothetical protein
MKMSGHLANGGEALFKRSLDVLAEQADAQYEAQAALWKSGRITDREYAAAVAAFTTKADHLQKMWAQWLRGEPA